MWDELIGLFDVEIGELFFVIVVICYGIMLLFVIVDCFIIDEVIGEQMGIEEVQNLVIM